jgi:Ca-activated chloride channel homolog
MEKQSLIQSIKKSKNIPMKRIFLHLLLLFVLSSTWAQLIVDDDRQRVREGNDFYEAGKYVEAEVSYRKAGEANAEQVKGAFNLGNALYQQGRYQEAAQQFARAAGLSDDRQLQAEAYHNLGNAHLKAAMQPQSSPQGPGQAQGNPLQQSIEAYKQALRRNPQDEETRYNLAYAMRQLQQQQQQQNNDQNQENQDQEKNQDQSEQDEQAQQDDQNQEQQDDREKQDQQADEQEQKQQQGRAQKMSPEEIEQMLEALRYQEEKLRQDMQRQQTKSQQRKVEKDW